MMQRRFLLTVLVLFHVCVEAQINELANGQTFDGIITEEKAGFIFQKTAQFPNNIELAMAIIFDGKPVFYGVKRENDTLKTTVNHRKVFEVGSITKVFTATLLAGLVLEGRISLNEDIAPYLNFELKGNPEITFEQLANHTSGLYRLPSNMELFTNPQNPYKAYDDEKLEEYLTEKLKLAPENEKRYNYSNLGAGLLGFVLSKIEGLGYHQMLKERIFSKYQMARSTIDNKEVENILVKGRDDKGKEVSNWDFDVFAGAGAILSSAEDLSKFAMAQFDEGNEELGLTRKSTFSISDGQAIGLGWHITKTESRNEWVWHNGGTGGYRSCMVVDIGKKNAVVILSNVSAFHQNSNKIDELCFGLIELLK